MKKEDLIKELKEFNFSKKIISAFEEVKREDFISNKFKWRAYENIPLPTMAGQTISQPYTIAFMLSKLDIKDGQDILEVGSGCGYVLALLSCINKKGKIFGIERIEELVKKSKENLKSFRNVRVEHANALPELKNKKFDRIIVSAAFDEIPEGIIEKNLKNNGVSVFPVRNSIFVIKKVNKKNIIEKHEGFIFVPIIDKKS
ncbi:MAG: methyltransferase domain-containing protein [Candidatus Pacearchaeota archaeon]